MQTAEFPNLHRWSTPCSDVKDLVFHYLVDKGQQLLFSVSDDEFVYEFCFENFGPYQVADEGFLRCYQIEEIPGSPLAESAKRPILAPGAYGWTFSVSNSSWAESFNRGFSDMWFSEGCQHYLILTCDSCLDILAQQPPSISITKLKDTK